MSVSEAVQRNTAVRVWHASGDSRVGIATVFLTIEGLPWRYTVQPLNQTNQKYTQMSSAELNQDWLIAPRVDVKWMNVGSVWIRNEDHKFWNRPVPAHFWCEIIKPIGEAGMVTFQVTPKALRGKKAKPQTFSESCFNFMWRYTRLWGAETAKGAFPQEPVPFIAKALPGRPRKPKPQPQSALDRLLERDLIPE